MFNALYRLIMLIINWFKNLFRKKKKEETDENIRKEKDTSRITPMTFVKGVVDVGVSIYNQNHAQKIEKIEYLEIEIEKLKENIDYISKEEGKEKLEQLTTRLEVLKKNLEKKQPGTVRERKIKVQDLKKVDNKVNEVKELISYNIERIEPKLITTVIHEEKTKENVEPVSVVKKLVNEKTINEPIINREQELLKDEKKKDNKIGSLAHDLNLSPKVENIIASLGISINSNNVRNELGQYKQYVKDGNKVLKDSKKELKELTKEISSNITNTKLDRNKYKIEEIKSKISKIKSMYYDFKHSDYIYVLENDFELNNLDEFKIIQSEEEIDLYLAKCDLLINTIEEKKTKLVDVSEYSYNVSLPEKEPVLTKVDEPEEQKKVITSDIEVASNTVKRNIETQKTSIDKMMRKLDNAPIYVQRKRRLSFFDNIISNTLRIGLSLLPLRLIRNRPLGLLVTGIMLNNSIRSMRRVVTDIEINYVELNRRVRTQMNILNSYNTVCNDSLYQISCLKEEFERTYGLDSENPEVRKALAKLDILETQVASQQFKLQDTKERIHQKVKVLERKYK